MAINWVDRVPTKPGRIKITPEDGSSAWYGVMERADEPSVVGTPVNAANLNTMQKNAGLDANMTVYVAVSGSDRTGDGSSTAPYQTITKAISTIPKNLNGFNAIINIASGTYNEDVFIEKTFGGIVTLSGETDAPVSIKSLRVFNGSVVEINLPLTITGSINNIALYIFNAKVLAGAEITLTGVADYGVFVNRNGYGRFTTLSVSNTTVGAITSTNMSALSVISSSGSNNAVGIRTSDGGVIVYINNTLTATTLYLSQTGGRIYSGSQTNIPNY